jgi:hypothetical protein
VAGSSEQQVLRWIRRRERLDHLLCRPPGRRVRCDVEVEHPAAMMGKNEKHEEDLVSHGRHDEEVNRDDVPDMDARRSRCPAAR